jgi:hypothetical protein
MGLRKPRRVAAIALLGLLVVLSGVFILLPKERLSEGIAGVRRQGGYFILLNSGTRFRYRWWKQNWEHSGSTIVGGFQEPRIYRYDTGEFVAQFHYESLSGVFLRLLSEKKGNKESAIFVFRDGYKIIGVSQNSSGGDRDGVVRFQIEVGTAEAEMDSQGIVYTIKDGQLANANMLLGGKWEQSAIRLHMNAVSQLFACGVCVALAEREGSVVHWRCINGGEVVWEGDKPNGEFLQNAFLRHGEVELLWNSDGRLAVHENGNVTAIGGFKARLFAWCPETHEFLLIPFSQEGDEGETVTDIVDYSGKKRRQIILKRPIVAHPIR